MCKVNPCSKSCSITRRSPLYAIIATSPADRDSSQESAAADAPTELSAPSAAGDGSLAPLRITYLDFATVAAGAECEQVVQSGLRSAIRENRVILSFEGLLTHNSGKIDR
jgi:hypothetical protein